MRSAFHRLPALGPINEESIGLAVRWPKGPARSLAGSLSLGRHRAVPPPAGRGRTRKVSQGTQVTPPAPHRKSPKRAPSHPLRSRRAEEAGTREGSVSPRARAAREVGASRGRASAAGRPGGARDARRAHAPREQSSERAWRPGVTLRGQRKRGEEWGEEPGRRRPEAHGSERKRRRRRGGGKGSGSYLLRAGAPAASSSA